MHFRIIYVIVFLITFKTTYVCLSLLCLPLSGFPCLCISFSLLPHSGFFSVCLSLLCPPLLFFRVCLFVFLFSLYLASSVCLSFSSLSPSFWLVVCLSIYLSLLCLPLYGLLYLCLCPSVSLYLKTPITKSGCGSEAWRWLKRELGWIHSFTWRHWCILPIVTLERAVENSQHRWLQNQEQRNGAQDVKVAINVVTYIHEEFLTFFML